MTIRPTQSSIFNLVRMGLLENTRATTTAQEKLATGRELLRPSDDPARFAQVASLQRQVARGDRFTQAVGDARSLLDSGASAVQDVSELVTQARDLVIQGLNGTYTDSDRASLATEIEVIRDQVLEFANQQLGEQYLFAGSSTTARPFVSTTVNGRNVVRYTGNDESLEVAIGVEATLETTLPGDRVFGRRTPGQLSFTDLTGAQPGNSTGQGVGYVYLELRHDATSGALGSGLAFANGGAADTILGNHVVTVDAAAGTVQLDNGLPRALPAPGDPELADFRLENESGAELHLDFGGFTGAGSTSTVLGDGSASIDGANFTALDFVTQDLRLDDASTDTALFVDTTGIHRAGSELVTFGGSVNLFDTLAGIAEDMRNADGLTATQVADRLNRRLGELDRNHDNALQGLGVLGARSARVAGLEDRLQDSNLQLESLISERRDADVSQVILDMAQAQQALETTQASSVRLLQTSLLNFLR